MCVYTYGTCNISKLRKNTESVISGIYVYNVHIDDNNRTSVGTTKTI